MDLPHLHRALVGVLVGEGHLDPARTSRGYLPKEALATLYRRPLRALSGPLATLTIGVLALAGGYAPAAAAPTRAYAATALGKLSVTAEVVFAGATARFLGGWSNPTVSCSATRRVVLEATISYVPAPATPGPPRRVSSRTTGHVANCPPGGQGLDLGYLAKHVRLACPGGRWRPGNYDLVATVIVAGGSPTDVALSAEAELSSTKEVQCGLP